MRNGQIFNGADDNASGVAALLAVAARISASKPAHSVVFAALDAEETGLNGARAFLADPPVPREGIVMNVNLDMVARDAKNILFASGTFHYPFLKAYLKDVARAPVALRLWARRAERQGRRRLDAGLGPLSLSPGGHSVHLLWRRRRSPAPQGNR